MSRYGKMLRPFSMEQLPIICRMEAMGLNAEKQMKMEVDLLVCLV